LVMLAAMLVVALALAVLALTPASYPEPGFAPVAEDDPGWDCRTMGNRECGR
jgi:hypothetical protein